jgi:hypothetical protein
MAHEQAAAGLELDRDEVDVDISGFRQGPQVARIGGENIVAVGGQAHHGGVNRIWLATAGQQQPRPAPQQVIDRCDIGPGEQPGDWHLAATATTPDLRNHSPTGHRHPPR